MPWVFGVCLFPPWRDYVRHASCCWRQGFSELCRYTGDARGVSQIIRRPRVTVASSGRTCKLVNYYGGPRRRTAKV